MSKLLFSAALVAAALAGAAAVGDDKAAPKLDGGYTLISGEKDGKAIPEERLEARPWANLCIDCQRAADRP